MTAYILFWVCVIGLCLGSFYNVVILRSLSNESIVFPPSKCPKCNHKLYWWHNIPVLSFLILRGKCWFCGEKISIQYPVVEIATMFLFAVTFLTFGVSTNTLYLLFFISCLIIMTVTDLKERVADCNIAIVMAIAGLFYHGDIVCSLLGLLAGVLIVEAVARLGYLFAGTRAMGEADTYVAGALGAVFGIHNILYILLYSLIASMIFILPVFFYNQYKNNNKAVCILAVLFILSILVFKTVSQNCFTLALLALTGAALSYTILKGIKQEENRNYLPFVPALSTGALYLIFFGVHYL